VRSSAPTSAAVDCPACRFGRFELQPDERRLLADGQAVALGARAFDLLVALVARAGTLVSKYDLLDLVWRDLVVEENNLQVQISSLRKLLGPGALATIPGRGYRFELPVVRATDAPPPPRLDTGTAAPAAPSCAPAPPPARLPTNIPLRLSSVYGRADDIEAIKALLARHVVVTIAGAGGIGKTRVAQTLAAQLAVEHAADYPDGVWWVELAPLADGALVASAVARVLNTQLGADRPQLETIAAVLAPQRLLLVLDNCEHLADAVASLIEAVCAAAPGLHVLVTSQETLKTSDEHVYRLGALAVPAADADIDAMSAGAVELFVARAQAADPRFALTDQNAHAVVEICRRLDGIPLAIELAAARLPLLGIEGLRGRLDERFSILSGGARVVLRRHQTLRATLEWSHGLLTPQEQTVFRRLGVFAGSFTLEAAQHVVQDEAIDAWSALDHLGALVDKSLVLAEGDPLPRYRLLETTRAYALERIGEAGETDAMLRRHAEALLRVLTAIEREEQPMQFASAAAAELDNLRAALAWVATAGGSEELAVGLAGNSIRVWNSSHQLNEGMERCLALRQHLRDGVPPAVIARFWFAVAQLGIFSTRRESVEAARRAADLYRQQGDAGGLFDALMASAVQGVRFGTIEEMATAIDEAAGLARPDWPAGRRAMFEFARSRWFALQGRMEESLVAAQRRADILLQSGNEIGSHYAMSSVIAAQMQLGRTEIGLAQARSSIARLEVIGGSAGAGHLWLQVLVGEALLGRVDAALAAGRTSYALVLREGDQLRVFRALALCAALQNRLQDAARILGYNDAALARTGAKREAHWSRVRDRLEPMLAAGLAPDELARLRAEGAALREDDAVRLALGDRR